MLQRDGNNQIGIAKEMITTQVDRLRTVRKKRILKHVGAKITFRPSTAIVLFLALRSRRRSMGAPFSLQSKQLQPDYVSSYKIWR